MKLKRSEFIALIAVILTVLYSVAENKVDSDKRLKGRINRRILKEDSTVVLIDLPVSRTEIAY